MIRLTPTPLDGLMLVDTDPLVDERGEFVRVFCARELAAFRPEMCWSQINISLTRERGSVRGMHYQTPPFAECKLIRCLQGVVWDVAVDLRRGSPTFLQWHAVELDARGRRQILIPEGFAHGFQALTRDVRLLYMHTQAWNAAHEERVHHADPRLGINWPLPVVQLSQKDRSAAFVTSEFYGVNL